MMKIKCNRSQRAAIMVGENEYGEQDIELDVSTLTGHQREVLADLIRYPINVSHYNPDSIVDAINNTIDNRERDICRYLQMDIDKFDEVSEYSSFQPYKSDSRITARLVGVAAREQQRKQKQYDSNISLILELSPEQYATRYSRGYQLHDDHENEPRLAELRKAAQAVLDSRKLEAEQKEQQKLAKQAAIELFYENFVKTNMGTNAQERFAEGLLPRDEIRQAVKEFLFSPLMSFLDYTELTIDECEGDHPNQYYDDDVDIDISITDSEEATPTEWETLTAMRKIVEPLGGTAILQTHEGDCGVDDHPLLRKSSIKVTITACPGLVFSKHYECA